MSTISPEQKIITYRTIFDISHLLTLRAQRIASQKCGYMQYQSPPFRLGQNSDEECSLFFKIPFANRPGYRMFCLKINNGNEKLPKPGKLYRVVCSILNHPTIFCEAYLKTRSNVMSSDTAFCFNFFDVETLLKNASDKTVKIICDVTPYPSDREISSIRNYGPSGKKQLIENLKSLLESENYSDVTFVVRGSKLRAHKAILSARCEYFAKMFESGMNEQHTDLINVPQDIGLNEMKELLRYIYTGVVENLEHIGLSLLKAADMYGVEELKAECCEFLLANINVDNVTNILESSLELNISTLAYAAIVFVKDNLSVMMKRSDYVDFLIQSISAKTVANILVISENYNVAKVKAAAMEFILRNKEKILDNRKYRRLYTSRGTLILKVDDHVFRLKETSILKYRRRLRPRRWRLVS